MVAAVLEKLSIDVRGRGDSLYLATLVVQPTLMDRIKEGQKKDAEMGNILNRVLEGKESSFRVSEDGVLHLGKRVCIPNDDSIKKEILVKAHSSPYLVYRGSTKMYRDLRAIYWWPYMKMEVAHHVEQCLPCQQVKTEH